MDYLKILRENPNLAAVIQSSMWIPKHWRNMGRGSVTVTWKIWIGAACGGCLMCSVSLPVRRWLLFWRGSAKQHSASPCISVFSMRTTEA